MKISGYIQQGALRRMRDAALCACLTGLAGAALAEPALRRVSATPVVRGAPAPADAEGVACAAIPDDAYDGTLGSMMCVDVPGIDATVEHVALHLGLRHRFAGDLAIKVVDPGHRVVTVMSRPGMAEAADNGAGCCGSPAGLTQTSPIRFADDADGPSAEALGAGLRDSQVVCRDNPHCAFVPAAGAAAPGGLSTFNGANGAGTWKVCVGDGESLESGGLCSAVLAFNRLESDLSLTATFPGGMTADGPYVLAFDAVNRGPTAQTNVAVNAVLSSGMSYVSDDCGGAADGDGWHWNAGALGVDAHARCNVTVRMAQSGHCRAVSATANIAGDVADPSPQNNLAVAQEGDANRVLDPSLETSGLASGGDWTSTSTNFGHVFCAAGRCTDVPTLNAYDGDWWAWFGGADPANAVLPEIGTLRQTVAIPAGATALAFRLRAPSCSGDPSDYLALNVDGVELWRADASDGALCGAGYMLQSVDVSAFADGENHVVELHGEQVAAGSGTSFFVDEVQLVAPAVCGRGDRVYGDGFDPSAP